MANMCGYMDLSRAKNEEKYVVIVRKGNTEKFNFLDFIKPKYNSETEETSGLEEEIEH